MTKYIFTALLLTASLAGAAEIPASRDQSPATQAQIIGKAGAQPATKGPAANFTGAVEVGPLLAAGAASTFSAAQVTFAPGARSAWHVHPAGQYLVVTAGSGWTQEWGGAPVAIRAGDAVWCPPGVKHWHGASRTSGLSHVAMTGTKDGNNVTWMEQVDDAHYPR